LRLIASHRAKFTMLDKIKDGKAAGAASAKQIDLYIMDMTKNEREIVKAGCLINFNKNRNAK
jgi:hypothetical protein